jgi:FkbM family methyltransferase
MPLAALQHVIRTFGSIAGNQTQPRLRLALEYLRIGARYASAGTSETTKRARCGGHLVQYRHPRSLYTTFKTVWIDEEYLFVDLPPTPFILDCGANIGLATLWFKQLRPSAEMIAVEPSPTSLELLRANLRASGYGGVNVVPAALAREPGRVRLHEEHPAGVSTHLSAAGEIEVDAVRLSDLIHRPIDLLKLDVEGQELAVLRDLETAGKLPMVARIAVECALHAATEDQSLAEVLGLLERSRYEYTIDARSGRPLDSMQSVTIRAWRSSD